MENLHEGLHSQGQVVYKVILCMAMNIKGYRYQWYPLLVLTFRVSKIVKYKLLI